MISNIQILRAIAAILVVAFHTVPAAKSYNLPTEFFYKVDIWGAAGVDIFFIISGFIMVYIQINKKKKPLDFLKDRIERIVPLYWFLTLFIAALLIVFPQAFRELSLSSNHLIKSLFFINHIGGDGLPLLYVGWTLEYEMLFYIVFASSLFFKRIKHSILISIIILATFVFYGLSSIVIEFMYGMLVGYLFNKFKINSIFSLIFMLVGFYLLTVNWSTDMPRSLTWGMPSLLIFLGFLYFKPINSSLLEVLGNASYSIYLVQVFSIPISYKVFSKIGSLNLIYINEIYVIVCIFISVIGGVVLHFAIEKPLARIIKKIRPNRKSENVVIKY